MIHGDTARSSAQCKDGPRGLGDQCCYIVNCSYHSNEGMEGAGPQCWGTHSLFVILHLWRGRELRAAPDLSSSSRRLWLTSSEEQRSVSSYSRRICEETKENSQIFHSNFQLFQTRCSVDFSTFLYSSFHLSIFSLCSVLIIHLIWWSDGRSCCNENALKLDLNTLAIFLALFVR